MAKKLLILIPTMVLPAEVDAMLASLRDTSEASADAIMGDSPTALAEFLEALGDMAAIANWTKAHCS